MKNTELLEWMNDLDPKYLTEAQQPQIQMRKKPRRFVPVLIAAAVAATCLTAGVSAYVGYNKQMVQFCLGTIGEARMAEIAMPEPVTYHTDEMSVTVETVLSDGMYAMILLTYEPLDSSIPYDWTEFDDFPCNAGLKWVWFGDESCNYMERDYIENALDLQNTVNQRWEILFCEIPDGASCEEAHLDFQTAEVEDPDTGEVIMKGEMLDGISVPLDLTPNVETVQMVADDGSEIMISAYEMIVYGRKLSHNEIMDMTVTWANGKEQTLGFTSATSHYSDPISAVHYALSPDDGDPSSHGSPEDWYGFIDVNEVAAIRVGDTVYYPAK